MPNKNSNTDRNEPKNKQTKHAKLDKETLIKPSFYSDFTVILKMLP